MNRPIVVIPLVSSGPWKSGQRWTGPSDFAGEPNQSRAFSMLTLEHVHRPVPTTKRKVRLQRGGKKRLRATSVFPNGSDD